MPQDLKEHLTTFTDFHTLRKLIVSMNTSSRVGQCSVFKSYPITHFPVSTVYSLIMLTEVIYTLMRVY